MNNTIYTASCLCGDIKINITAEPVAMLNCHCKDCQKWTGCAYEPAVAFNKSDIQLQGQVNFFDKTSDSGSVVSRGSCANCCGSIINKCTAFDHLYILYAGTIDSENFKHTPLAEIYTRSRMNDHCELENTPQYQGALQR
ncbi:GFA family protein [Cysteiniphilum sp. QT6929]|uniref:GFA family protein n=1 Tax=Cysteiniphilum sp. QT6929 TaxID=2975055 RepID=UPI0024B3C344|nr:GFA family protein [Cysteiniphilum sp. QT6929]WHN64939.1 GFA family protein [Cysteiniphilum sp. QT6929]